ncbi:MAG: ferrochelatase [Thermoanaerobaculia bacterium]
MRRGGDAINLYAQEPHSEHGRLPAVGVLLANLGTPDAPTAVALRRFLREFLGDPRVIEEPRWKWWLILNLLILPFRPRRSAALYRKIWEKEGSPLLSRSLRLGEGVTGILAQAVGSPLHVAVGMRYGRPSMRQALMDLRRKGCNKLLVIPMFPQYSGTTVGSVFDALAAELVTWRVVPSLRTVHHYHDEPAYIGELAASIREVWERNGKPEKLLFSFHGIPLRYFTGGDPYHCECHKTARLVAERLHLSEPEYEVAFQSIFGKEEWIKPTADVTIRAMARSGVKKLDVICPGFSVDCLETLEEIKLLNRGFFLDNGGERFRYIPCLNDRPGHARMLADLIRRNLDGWVTDTEDWDAASALAEAQTSSRRADALQSRGAPANAGYSS